MVAAAGHLADQAAAQVAGDEAGHHAVGAVAVGAIAQLTEVVFTPAAERAEEEPCGYSYGFGSECNHWL